MIVSARENEAAPLRSTEAVEAVRALKPDLEVTGEDPIGSGSGVMVRAGSSRVAGVSLTGWQASDHGTAGVGRNFA